MDRNRVASDNSASKAEAPSLSPTLLTAFQCYTRGYLRRAFHAVRLARTGDTIDQDKPDRPLVVYLNHPAWWDPLLCLFLSRTLFPHRDHYAPMQEAALQRYRIFTRFGFFGIDTETQRGAARFLRASQAILSRPQTAIWLTPQGAFSDPRQRPVHLQPGIGHLAKRLPNGRFIPLALEYPFWTERFPEALARFGDEVAIEPGHDPDDYTYVLAKQLEATQDALARDAIRQTQAAFDVLLQGRTGVGGVYDRWRALRARIRGESFNKAHGTGNG